MKDEGWRMKDEEWKMKNEEWRMNNEEWTMKLWGYRDMKAKYGANSTPVPVCLKAHPQHLIISLNLVK